MSKKILIIEDDKDISRTLEIQLQSCGFFTNAEKDGREGLKKAQTLRPDLIVLDLGLPGMPGEEVCRQLRKDEANRNLPIIMLTAKGTDVDKVIGRVIGADVYIAKPFDLDALIEKIKTLSSSPLF